MSPGHADTVTPSLLFTHDPQHRAHSVHLVDSLERAPRSRCGRSASRALWVTKMRRASSPIPRCCIDRIDTP